MAGVVEEFVSGIVSSALKEVLTKSGVRKATTAHPPSYDQGEVRRPPGRYRRGRAAAETRPQAGQPAPDRGRAQQTAPRLVPGSRPSRVPSSDLMEHIDAG